MVTPPAPTILTADRVKALSDRAIDIRCGGRSEKYQRDGEDGSFPADEVLALAASHEAQREKIAELEADLHENERLVERVWQERDDETEKAVQAERRVAELEATLEEVEWNGYSHIGLEPCPCCGNERVKGHSANCLVGAALSRGVPTPDKEPDDRDPREDWFDDGSGQVMR